MGFDNSTNPAQVPQAKNGEQLPSDWFLSSLEEFSNWSAQQSSISQQGIIVPADVMMSNRRTNHFFIPPKDKIRLLLLTKQCLNRSCGVSLFNTNRCTGYQTGGPVVF